MSPPLALQVNDVSKRFDRVQSLDRLSLAVESGAVMGFLGPNGAGKTTTLRILLGLVRPDAGSLSVLGLDPRAAGEAVRAQVGVLLENDGLYDRLSAWNNLDYHGRIHHLPAPARRARIEELLRSFDLWDRRGDRVATWSKGMRQKLAIARALLHRPRLLLLDEPFTGLDPAAAADLRERIVTLARHDEVTGMLTTHDLAHVEKSCSQVAVIQGGHVIATGSPDSLVGGTDELDVRVRGAGLSATVLDGMKDDGLILGYALDAAAGARLRCTREARARLGVELVGRGVALEELATARRSLEEAFLALTARTSARGAA